MGARRGDFNGGLPTASVHGERDKGEGSTARGSGRARWRPHPRKARVGGELVGLEQAQGRRVGPRVHGMHVQDTVQNASGIAMPRVLQGELAKMVIPIGCSHHHLNDQTKNQQKKQSW